MPATRHLTLTPSRHALPEGWSPELFRDEVEQAAASFSHPAIACTSLRVLVAEPAPRWIAVEDGVNLVAFRAEAWCHNGRCGRLDTFPLRAMAMTQTYPNAARGAGVREGDVELNAAHFRFVAALAEAAPNQLVVPLRPVLLHELGHLLGLSDRCAPEGSHGAHAALPDRSACRPGEEESVMFAPALNLELSQLDIATLCALHPSEHAATPRSPGEEAGGQAPLDLSLPWTFAIAVLVTLAGVRFVRRQRARKSSRPGPPRSTGRLQPFHAVLTSVSVTSSPARWAARRRARERRS